MSSELNNVERRAIQEAINYADPKHASILATQARRLHVTRRETAETRFVTYVQVDPQVPRLEEKKQIVLYSCGDIDGVNVEFLSFVENGEMQSLEGHTYGGERYPFEKDQLLRFWQG